MEIPKNLKDEIWEYCRLNDISNIDEFIIKMIRQGYTIEKFGSTPLGGNEVKEIEKIVEVIREVPVEKIIEKEIFITDDIQITELTNKLTQLEEEKKIFSTKTTEIGTIREEFSTKSTEMENIFQNEMSKKDKELDELRHSLDILRQSSQVEKIVEVIKEVPVEKIVIQEKIVEVEKESTDSNLKTKFDALQSTVQKLKLDNIEKDKQLREYEKTIEEIQKFQVERKAAFLKGSNLDDTLYSKKL